MIKPDYSKKFCISVQFEYKSQPWSKSLHFIFMQNEMKARLSKSLCTPYRYYALTNWVVHFLFKKFPHDCLCRVFIQETRREKKELTLLLFHLYCAKEKTRTNKLVYRESRYICHFLCYFCPLSKIISYSPRKWMRDGPGSIFWVSRKANISIFANFEEVILTLV